MMMKSLPNPLNASAGVSIPNEVSTINKPIVTRSTENLSVANKMIAIISNPITNEISKSEAIAMNTIAKKQKSIQNKNMES